MYYRKKKTIQGEYVDKEGIRWSVLAARRVRSSAGINAEYECFSSLEAALSAWNLSLARDVYPD